MTGATITGTQNGASVDFDINMDPTETYAFLAPRNVVGQAPLDWLKLQRTWWSGTKTPAPAPKLRPWSNTLQLDDDWAFEPLPANLKDASSLLEPPLNDKSWDRMDIGVWAGTKYPTTKSGIYRKHFSIPASWIGNGRTWLWMKASEDLTFLPPYKAGIYLDGKPVYDSGGWTYANCVADVTDQLTPGDHLIAVTALSNTPVGGINGNVWLEHIPEPVARQSLAGNWNGIQMPGSISSLTTELRRTFVPDPSMKGKKAVLYVETTQDNVVGIILNGRLMSRDIGGQHFLMDLTPTLLDNQPDDIQLLLQYPQNPLALKTVEIRYYEPGTI
jgi:hypothetical protein